MGAVHAGDDAALAGITGALEGFNQQMQYHQQRQYEQRLQAQSQEQSRQRQNRIDAALDEQYSRGHRDGTDSLFNQFMELSNSLEADRLIKKAYIYDFSVYHEKEMGKRCLPILARIHSSGCSTKGADLIRAAMYSGDKIIIDYSGEQIRVRRPE
jgi:hypothetical protein